MKRILFTGTWRLVTEGVERDVRDAARDVITRGDAIVTGGATGVDYFAMDEALKVDPTASRLTVVIPAPLTRYIEDYRENWMHPPVTKEHIDALDELLHKIQAANPEAIVEMPHDAPAITQDHYNTRHTEEVRRSDAVYAFQVNGSLGTQDTIDQAKAAGLSIELHKQYTV